MRVPAVVSAARCGDVRMGCCQRCCLTRVRAAIYARISQDRSGAQAGVTRQLEDTRKLAADLGWEVVEEFVDNDVSAKQRRWSTSQRRFVNTTRPRYEALLDA